MELLDTWMAAVLLCHLSLATQYSDRRFLLFFFFFFFGPCPPAVQ